MSLSEPCSPEDLEAKCFGMLDQLRNRLRNSSPLTEVGRNFRLGLSQALHNCVALSESLATSDTEIDTEPSAEDVEAALALIEIQRAPTSQAEDTAGSGPGGAVRRNPVRRQAKRHMPADSDPTAPADYSPRSAPKRPWGTASDHDGQRQYLSNGAGTNALSDGERDAKRPLLAQAFADPSPGYQDSLSQQSSPHQLHHVLYTPQWTNDPAMASINHPAAQLAHPRFYSPRPHPHQPQTLPAAYGSNGADHLPCAQELLMRAGSSNCAAVYPAQAASQGYPLAGSVPAQGFAYRGDYAMDGLLGSSVHSGVANGMASPICAVPSRGGQGGFDAGYMPAVAAAAGYSGQQQQQQQQLQQQPICHTSLPADVCASLNDLLLRRASGTVDAGHAGNDSRAGNNSSLANGCLSMLFPRTQAPSMNSAPGHTHSPPLPGHSNHALMSVLAAITSQRAPPAASNRGTHSGSAQPAQQQVPNTNNSSNNTNNNIAFLPQMLPPQLSSEQLSAVRMRLMELQHLHVAEPGLP